LASSASYFWPPTSPHQSAASIASFLGAHRTSIRLGLMLMAFGAAFLGPFLAEITVQMKRTEGRYSPLAYAQLALGAIFVLEFIVPETDAEIVGDGRPWTVLMISELSMPCR
jgi:hypothetical protein